MTTYKALERLSQSEFNLDRLEVTPSTATASIHNSDTAPNNSITTVPSRLTVPGKGRFNEILLLRKAVNDLVERYEL